MPAPAAVNATIAAAAAAAGANGPDDLPVPAAVNATIAVAAAAGANGPDNLPVPAAVDATVAAVGALGFDVREVMVGCETGVVFTDELAQALGCRGNGTAKSALRRNKWLQTEAVRSAGLNACGQALANSSEDVEAFLRQAESDTLSGGFKAVVKPVEGAGSDGVSICDSPDAVRAALDELMALRALDVRRDSATSASSDGAVSSDAEKHPNNPETLTPLGKHLAHMPVDARVGKMLLFGALLGCLDPILTIAAAMSGRQLFVSPKDKKAEADAMKKIIAAPGKSDHLTMASAYAAWWKCPGAGARRKHADERFLSHQALEGIMASRLDYAGVLADLGFIPRAYVRAMRRDGPGGTRAPARSRPRPRNAPTKPP